MGQFITLLVIFLAVTTFVVHGNYAGGGEGIVYLLEQLLQLAKPGTRFPMTYKEDVMGAELVLRGRHSGENINLSFHQLSWGAEVK